MSNTRLQGNIWIGYLSVHDDKNENKYRTYLKAPSPLAAVLIGFEAGFLSPQLPYAGQRYLFLKTLPILTASLPVPVTYSTTPRACGLGKHPRSRREIGDTGCDTPPPL